MSADSPRRSLGSSRGISVPATVPPQVVSDRSILDSAIGFINDVTLANQPHTDPKDTITWARFESAADISDPRFGEDWELEGNVAPPLLLILGYGLGVQVWAIPANGEAVEVLSWRHGIVAALRVLPTPSSSQCIEEHGRADEPIDGFAEKRPLIALVDGSSSVGSQPQFCAVNFVSLKGGPDNARVKTIKFKNPVLDILANRSSIVITFHERIAVFDARSLEDRLSITTCYPSPGINPNPVALGPRWLAYSEYKFIHSKRSGGGCDGEGVASYTATVLNAAKSLGKGLREFGEQVAAGLTGTTASVGSSKANSFDSVSGVDAKQPGIVTIMDIKYPVKDYSPTSGAPMCDYGGSDPIVAHFVAHSEAVVALEFDNSGMLLVTADRRGHDFHVFRIQPHPVGSSLAAVHHLYILHRGDTSAKVQNIAFALDSRWVAVSTLRGTTHVFPITPYGGPMGVRTHSSLHVVNKLSRFHRSAGLSADGRSNSPISHSESTTFVQSLQPYHNPTLPPFPRPSIVQPLAQLRQPFALGSPPGSAALSGGKSSGISSGGSSQRQRLSSLSDDNGKPLSVCSIFAKSRSWLLEPPNATREAPHRIQRKAVDSLFVMAGHGALIQYDLDTKLASNVAKEKICDDTPIELEVEAKAQWNLGRRKEGSQEIMPPLSSDNWLMKNRNSYLLTDSTRHYDDVDDRTESWLAQVEIITHAGPHRRLWMGPQFVFKTYNTPSGSNLNHVDAEAVEIGVPKPASTSAAAATRVERSSPLNMPLSATGRSSVPVLIESGSYSSIEQSPKLMDRFRHEHLDSDFAVSHGDSRLKEDLADAMRDCIPPNTRKDTGRLPSDAASSSDNAPFYDALAEHENDDEDQTFDLHRPGSTTSAAVLANALPNIFSYDTLSSGESSLDLMRKPKASIEKVVNPLGTVTTVTAGMTTEVKPDILDEVVSQLAAEETVIHENCDEALFRPVVAIFCDENARKLVEEDLRKTQELCKPPELVANKLIVPVIDKAVDAELCKKEKEKSGTKLKFQKRLQVTEEERKFAELSSLNKKAKAKLDKECAVERALKEMARGEKEKSEEKKFTGSKVLVDVKEKTKVVKKVVKPDYSDSSVIPTEFKRITSESEIPSGSPKRPVNEKNRKREESSAEVEVRSYEWDAETRSIIPKTEVNVLLQKSDNSSDIKKNASGYAEKATTSNKQTAENAISSAKEKTAIAESATIAKVLTVKQPFVDLKNSAKPEIKTTLKEKELNTDALQKYCVEVVELSGKTKITNASEQSKCVVSKDIKDNCFEGLKENATSAIVQDKKNSKSEIELVKLSEPVDIYLSPPKSGKRNKKKNNKSGSNSESEEVVEVVTVAKKLSSQTSQKSSLSSEESYTDLADSLSEIRSKIEDSTFTSVSQNDDDDAKKNKSPKKSTKLLSNNLMKIKPEVGEIDKKYVEVQKSSLPKALPTNVRTEDFESKFEIQSKIEAFAEKAPAKKEDEFMKNLKPRNAELIGKNELQVNRSKSEINSSKIEVVEKYTEKNYEDLTSKIAQSTKTEFDEITKPKSTPLRKEDGVLKKLKPKGAEELLPSSSPQVISAEKEDKVTSSTSNAKTQVKDLTKGGANLAEKSIESSKGAIRKDPSRKESFKHIDLEEKTKIIAKPKEKIQEDESKVEMKTYEITITEEEMKRSPKFQKKSKTAEDEIMPQPTGVLKSKQIKSVTKVDENKVITEQPTKTKKDSSADVRPHLYKEETATLQAEYPKSKEKLKKNAKEDVTDSSTTMIKHVADETDKSKVAETTETISKINETVLPGPASSVTSAWKTLGATDMIIRNLQDKSADEIYPSLGKPSRTSKKSPKTASVEFKTLDNLLADLSTTWNKSSDSKKGLESFKKFKETPDDDDFPLLKPLEALPPLPSLEPLEVMSTTIIKTREQNETKDLKDLLGEQISLINFESPLQENPALERKITPPPRGFTEQNLIIALCGSLHFENENEKSSADKVDVSPTLSLTRSSSALGEQSTADYKSLTENDDTYMSLEQSSQETNTTNTATTNEKLSSSPNSSASEDIIVLEDKKMTKKQRRKKLQMEEQKHKEQQLAGNRKVNVNDDADDEELCPLIAMTDSIKMPLTTEQLDAPSTVNATTLLMDIDSFTLKPRTTSSNSLLVHSTTTDSEGPMPATTSDDNVTFTLPSSVAQNTPNKLKTKKMEHKINLIAAIEAATSSSSASSAEESGVEGSAGGRLSDMDVPIAVTTSALPAALSQSTTAPQSASKKKTKRRKR